MGLRFGKKHFFQIGDKFSDTFVKNDIIYMTLFIFIFISKNPIILSPLKIVIENTHHTYFNGFSKHLKLCIIVK